jgi:hypothetical protein
LHILIDCVDCGEGPFSVQADYFAVTEHGTYEMNCPKGHHNLVVLCDERFELLFELGTRALANYYPREAVASFAAAVERFYEFCIEVLCHKFTVEDEKFQAAWKVASKQSERQLGAFTFVYLVAFGEPPPALPNKAVEFRNNVIHRGYFPTYEDSLDYGEKCRTLFSEVFDRLDGDHGDAIKAVLERHADSRTAWAEQNNPKDLPIKRIQRIGFTMAIRIAHKMGKQDKTVAEQVEFFRKGEKEEARVMVQASIIDAMIEEIKTKKSQRDSGDDNEQQPATSSDNQ